MSLRSTFFSAVAALIALAHSTTVAEACGFPEPRGGGTYMVNRCGVDVNYRFCYERSADGLREHSSLSCFRNQWGAGSVRANTMATIYHGRFPRVEYCYAPRRPSHDGTGVCR